MDRRSFLLRASSAISGFLAGSVAPSPTQYFFSPTGDDGNDGLTSLTPWQTHTKFNGLTINPGETVTFLDGTYGSGWTLVMPSDGEAGNRIKLVGSVDGQALFDGVRVYTDWTLHADAVWKRTDASADISQVFTGTTRMIYAASEVALAAGAFAYVSNVVYVRMTDDSDPNGKSVGYGRIDNGLAIKLNGKSHIEIDNIDFTRFNYGAVNTDVAGSDDIVIKNCLANWSCREFLIGVTVAGVATSPTHVTIQNCIGHDDLDVPFWIGHGSQLIVEHCEAYYNGKDVAPEAKNYPAASHFPDGICISADAEDCDVRYNYVHDNYLLAAITDELSLGARSNGVRIYGNRIDTSTNACYGISIAGANTLVYNNWINAGSGSAIILVNAPVTVRIYHNTLISPTGSQNSIDTTNQTMTLCHVKNNIIIRAGATNRYISVAANSKASFEADNNCYFGASTPKWFWGPTEYTTLGGWQAVVTGGDTGALDVDPVFVTANTDVHLQTTSPCKDAGMDLSAYVTIDYDEYARDATPSMGAFEFH